MKQKDLYFLISGGIAIVVGVVAVILHAGDISIPAFLIGVGISFLVTGIIRSWRGDDEPESDERLRKICAYSLSYAWLAGAGGIAVLFWLDYCGLLQLSSRDALGISELMLMIPAMTILGYLIKKGDVD
ncbi:MAG: hypothetical protein WC362_08150 [Methanoregula sp.]